MAGEPIIEFVGRLVRKPELNHVAGGTAVVNFSVAVTPRNRNPHTDTWDDGTPLFFDCAAWRRTAENITASYTKGLLVYVRGRLVDDSFERDGQTVRRWKVEVDETGPSMKVNTVTIDDRNGATPSAAATAPVPERSRLGADPSAPPF